MSTPESEWSTPPRELHLLEGEVHVWRFSLEQPAERVEELQRHLDPEERERCERFLLERVRRQFIVGRGFLRHTLARYLAGSPSAVRFAYGNYGKPSLGGGELSFNLTHSGERGLLAVTRRGELGVDLEKIRHVEDFEAIARRFFAPGEVEVLTGLDLAQRSLGFFHCWTRKEAFIKALGEGLSRPLDQFQVSLLPGEPARLLWVQDAPDEPERWEFHHLTPWPGYVGCVALAAQGWRRRCWEGI